MKIGKEVKRVKSPARRTRKHNEKGIPAWRVIPFPIQRPLVKPERVIITGA